MSKLQARQLGFGYPKFPVGRDVDVRIEPGEILCLLGPNGCGKTTLFKTILGLIPRQDGEISIDGRDIDELGRREIARSVAYVPQAHEAVFPYAVRDMVLMGRTAHQGLFSSPQAHDQRIADEALDLLGIAALADRDYTRISGGQRQLVLIARALAQDAPLIIMDEPTASLDFGNQILVLTQIRKLARAGLGIVLSTHNPDHAFACGTRVLVLSEGAALAEGPVADVLTAELLSSVYGVTVTVEELATGHRICAPDVSGADRDRR